MNDLAKMTLIGIVQQLPKEDISYVQRCVDFLEVKNEGLEKEVEQLKEQLNEIREYVEAFANLDFCTIKVTMLRPILEKINKVLGEDK